MKKRVYIETTVVSYFTARNGIEVLITWNFAHLNNPFTRRAIRRIVEEEGYVCPEICSPEELLEVNE